MRELGPTFIDITWGAGGTRADTTAQFVKAAHEEFGLETCMHLTCTDMPRDQVDKALEVGTGITLAYRRLNFPTSSLPPPIARLTVTYILVCVTLFLKHRTHITLAATTY